MRSSGCKTHSIRILCATALLCAPALLPAQQQGGTPQNIQLKDPTPRPPDLQKIYGAGQTDQAKQQEAHELRNAQIRQQVLDAAHKLYVLAQQLHDDVATAGKDPRTSDNATKAAQIEKLAKTVQEKTRQQ